MRGRHLYAKLTSIVAKTPLPRLHAARSIHGRVVAATGGGGVIDVRGSLLQLDPADCLYLGSHGYEPMESQVLLSLARPGQLVVDVGAMIGYYTVILAKCVGPAGRVVAFEPDPVNAALIRRSLKLNGYTHVEVVNKAVSDTRGYGHLHLALADRGDGRMFNPERDRRSFRVPLVRLDDVFPGRPPDLVKMDIQGSEGHALRGMLDIIGRSRTFILVCEFSPYLLANSGTNPTRFLQALELLGFSIFEVDEQRAAVIATSPKILASYYQPYRTDYTSLLCVRRLDGDPSELVRDAGIEIRTPPEMYDAELLQRIEREPVQT